METTIKSDQYGPEYVITVHDPKIGMKGFLVIDNTTLGPGKGGIRMTPDITAEEVFRLARTMTWKNALAGIPFGGAKAGIVWPAPAKDMAGKPGGADALKKSFVTSFARAISPFIPSRYIGGPDVNTGEREMAWIARELNEWNAVTGKPADFCTKKRGKKQCGLPHELGSTGFGVAAAARIAAQARGINIVGATVAIEGYGNVGSFALAHLAKMGAKIIAVSNRDCVVYNNKEGIDGVRLAAIKKKTGSIKEYEPAQKLPHKEIFGLAVDMLIPAAVTDVINESNKNAVKAKIIVEGANIPMSEAIEGELSKKGILIVPDFVANAGGVISSWAEYKGMSPKNMFRVVEEKISRATKTVLASAMKRGENPRIAALALARDIVERASTKRKRIF